MSFFPRDGDGGGLDWLSQLALPAFSLWNSTRANNRAADTARDTGIRSINALNQGAAGSQEAYGAITASAAPGASYLRRVVSQNPGEMNPWQVNALEDARLTAGNVGARTGSARQTAIINDGQNRLTAEFQKQNTGRADAAAGTMFNQGNAASMAGAGIPARLGEQTAGVIAGVGNNQANAITANAASTNAVLGGVGASADRQNMLAAINSAAQRSADNRVNERYKPLPISGSSA